MNNGRRAKHVRLAHHAAWHSVVAAVCLGVLVTASPSNAQEPPQEPWFEKEARIGFGEGEDVNGRYKLGMWTPVEVTLVGGPRKTAGVVKLRVLDGDGVPTEVAASNRVAVQPGQRVAVRFIARIGGTSENLRAVYLWQDGEKNEGVSERRLQDNSAALTYGRQFIVAVGRETAIEPAIKKHVQNWSTDAEPAVAQLRDTSTLPTRWYGYEGVNVLLLATSDPLVFESMNDAQREAIDQWVYQGGTLVLSVGQSVELIQPGGAFAKFRPGEFETQHQLTLGRGFESFLQKNPQPLFTKPDLRIPVPKLKNVPEAQVLASEADLPLIVNMPYGFGRVLFVAADLDQTMFHNWRSNDEFYRVLLDWPEQEQNQQEMDQWSYLGITDLSSQLRGALDQFEGVTLVPFGIVALLVVGYILLIGPIDYLFVKRVWKRMEMTWVTFPATVIAVSLFAYFLAGWLKGDKLRINQATVVDVDVEDGSVRGTSWINVFSPQTVRYNLDVAPDLPISQPPAESSNLLAWMGLPEDAIGGMDRRSSWGSSGNAYLVDLNAGALLQVPIQVWSTKTFTARWSQTGVELLEADLRAKQEDLQQAKLISHMNQPLEDCVLAYGGSVYEVGQLRPGATVDVSLAGRMSFKDRLKDTKLVRNAPGAPYQATPYNVGSHDVDEILKLMMFYEAADGPSYTQIRNSSQSFLDLSDHLAAGEAILLGRCKQSALHLQEDGERLGTDETKHWTWYRFVLPVLSVDQ